MRRTEGHHCSTVALASTILFIRLSALPLLIHQNCRMQPSLAQHSAPAQKCRQLELLIRAKYSNVDGLRVNVHVQLSARDLFPIPVT